MSKSDKVKPCPFCGCQIYLWNISSSLNIKFIECPQCSATSEPFSAGEYGKDKAEQQAIAAWNKRRV